MKLKEKFHQCLDLCKVLGCKSFLTDPTNMESLEKINADKLLFEHAIEMCQSAALEELFGLPDECFRRYQTAQILLHALSQQAGVEEADRNIVHRYRDAVQKRLFVLQKKGLVIAYDSGFEPVS